MCAALAPNFGTSTLPVETRIVRNPSRQRLSTLTAHWWTFQSSMFDEIANDLMGENYLRVNSPTGLVNRRMDDISDANLERIHLMGMEWWSKFGEKTSDFLNV